MASMEDPTTTVDRPAEPRQEPPDLPAERPFEEFFEAEHRGLYGALRLLTRDGHEAEELMQDAFLKLLERWDRIRALEDPTGYLYRTALNLFRSRRRRVRVALARVLRPASSRDELGEVESREAVMRALAPLTPGQRAAVVLTDVLGLTSEEAGEALRIKASTVRVQAARGRAALRQEMGESDG
jgi:RNA polymerase sigma-70 factor, ECF subfamily